MLSYPILIRSSLPYPSETTALTVNLAIDHILIKNTIIATTTFKFLLHLTTTAATAAIRFIILKNRSGFITMTLHLY